MKDFILAADDCGLERDGAYSLLRALAKMADGETGFARVSRTALMHSTRLTERSLQRAFKALSEAERGELLITAEAPRAGPGSTGLYRVHWERIAIVADAYRLARKRVRAGAAAALDEAELRGMPASPENCRRAIMALSKACRVEGYTGSAKKIAKLSGDLEAELSGWPERIAPRRAVDNERANPDNVSEDADKLSEDADKLSGAYSIDKSPQGNSPNAHTDTREARELPAVELSTLAGYLSCRRQRLKLLEALMASGCQLRRAGDVLLLSSADGETRQRIEREWGVQLTCAALDAGFHSIAMTARAA